MPRAKQTKDKSVPSDAPTSDDAAAAVPAVEAPIGDIFEPGTAAPAEPVEDAKSKPKKGSRKPKPCVRCDERRKREREYARASRVRSKLAKTSGESAAVPSAEPTAESAAEASATVPAVEAPMAVVA
jgi:hypothetical protein